MKYYIIFSFQFISIFCLKHSDVLAQTTSAADSMKQLLKTKLTNRDRAKTLINLSRNYMYSGHFDTGYKYILPAFHLSKNNLDTFGIANSANTLGHYHAHVGQNDSAFYYYGISVENFGKMNDSVQIAGLYNNIGNVYSNQGNIPEALNYYFRSLTLKERMGDSYGAANSSTNLGNLYNQYNDSVNALKFLLKGLIIREKMKDTVEIANSYTALGLYYRKRKDYGRASTYLKEAVHMLEKTSDEQGEAIARYNLGNVYQEMGELSSAEDMYAKALEYSLTNNDREGIASCYETLGGMKMQAGKINEAIEFFEKALVAAKETQITELQSNIYSELYNTYEKKGNFKKALYYFKEWRTLEDSLFNEENIQKLTSSELKYEHEKEKLRLMAEQEKRENMAKEHNFRKNVLIVCCLGFLLLVSIFAGILYRRLQVNRAQKNLIELQNREILDSITYAKRIQNALLADKNVIKRFFPSSFVLYKPKDIVSGDFYWANHIVEMKSDNDANQIRKRELFLLAVCDSTGHGVPGAFMSLLNTGFLNEAVTENKIHEPHQIFEYARKRLIDSIAKDEQKDGMDSVIICLDDTTKDISYAGANINPVIIRNGELIELPYDKMPVGKGVRSEPFNLFTLPVQEGDRVYLFTDGYADQFGGAKGKKFMYKQLLQFLFEISTQPMDRQLELLEQRFNEWRGALEQVDDVCIVGLEIELQRGRIL